MQEQNNIKVMTTTNPVENKVVKQPLDERAEIAWSEMDMNELHNVILEAKRDNVTLSRSWSAAEAYKNHLISLQSCTSEMEKVLTGLQGILNHEDFGAAIYGIAKNRWRMDDFDELREIAEFNGSYLYADLDEFTESDWYHMKLSSANSEQSGHDEFDSEREEGMS